MNIASVARGKLTWVNIEAPTKQETDYLAQNYSFNQLDLDDCLSRRQRPKIDEYEDYLFVVLHFPKWHKEVEIARPSQVAIFIGRNYVVTVHAGELTPLVKLFAACQEHTAARQMFMGKDSVFLAYRIIDLLVDYCFPIMDKILSKVEDVEDKVFDETIEATHELAVLRRDIIAQRRIIWPLRTVIGELEAKLKKFTNMDMSVYFGDLLDHLNKIWDTLEECKEVIEVFKDSDYVLSTENINRVMRILTIFSSIVLPFILVSSIYGMNISLPGGVEGGSLSSFLTLLLIAALISLSMLYFFHRKRWI
ncbi:MAG: magnesium transporter [Chloroflexi bacterium RBG_13_56_8b]|nr:MAG: magnesium transporter [Chloroflexi bacterium RBG_13_56_8b]